MSLTTTGDTGRRFPVPPAASHRLGSYQRERHASPQNPRRGRRAVQRSASPLPEDGGQGPIFFHTPGSFFAVVTGCAVKARGHFFFCPCAVALFIVAV